MRKMRTSTAGGGVSLMWIALYWTVTFCWLANYCLAGKHSDLVRQGRLGGPEPRIVNGVNAREWRFPWFVRLVGEAQCGGVLIARDLVLTAAHCEGSFRRAEIGRYNVENRNEGQPFRPTVSEHPHPNWQGNIPYFDIMMVKLERPVTQDYYEPIKLNFDDTVPSNTGERLRMLGFGSTTTAEDGLVIPTILQEAETAYMAFEDCAVANNPETGAAFGNSVTDTEVTGDWFCTLLNTPERFGTCFGDSGGPIFIEGDGPTEDILVATISGAQGGCGNRFLPDISQRVSFHEAWILEEGCGLSEMPPDYWNCEGANGNPTDAPVSPAPTPAPVAQPTLSPVTQPTPSPTTASPVATLPPNPSPDNGAIPATPEEPVADGIVSVYVVINFDSEPRDIAWFISDENLEEFRIGAPWGAYQPGTDRAEELVYLRTGDRYRFTIEDLRGNGLSEGEGGTYQVVLGGVDGTVLAQGGGNFGDEETSFFSIP